MINLAVILARANSKRLPNKNILPLNGIPLIGYSIKAAKSSSYVSDVIVSTDSEAIANVAKMQGASIPFMRPDYLATDSSTSEDSLHHAVLEYEKINDVKVDNVILIQPTSPFTCNLMIDRCIDQVVKNDFNSAFTVTIPAKRCEWFGHICDGRFVKFLEKEQRQSLGDVRQFVPSGNVYVVKRDFIVAFKKIVDEANVAAIIVEQKQAIDIDYELDFLFADFLMKQFK